MPRTGWPTPAHRALRRRRRKGNGRAGDLLNCEVTASGPHRDLGTEPGGGSPVPPWASIHHRTQGRTADSPDRASRPRGQRPSIGTAGDACDSMLMETVYGLCKAESLRTAVFHACPCRPLADLEHASAGRADWYDSRRFRGPRGMLIPRVPETLHDEAFTREPEPTIRRQVISADSRCLQRHDQTHELPRLFPGDTQGVPGPSTRNSVAQWLTPDRSIWSPPKLLWAPRKATMMHKHGDPGGRLSASPRRVGSSGPPRADPPPRHTIGWILDHPRSVLRCWSRDPSRFPERSGGGPSSLLTSTLEVASRGGQGVAEQAVKADEVRLRCTAMVTAACWVMRTSRRRLQRRRRSSLSGQAHGRLSLVEVLEISRAVVRS